jgi:hypothetical protein
MSRKLMTVLLSSALVLGAPATSAWSAADVAGGTKITSVQVVDPAKNQAPLPPGGAAGIKQAQGFLSDNPGLTIALAIGVIALIWILVDDDDEDVPTTTTGT